MEDTNLKNKPLQMFEHLFCTPLIVGNKRGPVFSQASEPQSLYTLST